MRLVLTIPLCIVFAVACAAMFLVDGALRASTDTDELVATAAQAGVRDALVDATEAFLYRGIANDPDLQGLSRPQLHALVDEVMAPAWFEESLRRAHAALLGALEESGDDAIIDLRPTKSELERAVGALEGRAGDTCARLLGDARCADPAEARALLVRYDSRVRDSIAQIPDQVDLVRELGGGRGERTDLSRARRWFGGAGTVRWAGLAVLAVLLLVIGLINVVPLHRLLLALGAALAGAALLTVLVYGPARRAAHGPIEDEIARLREQGRGRTDEIVDRIAPAAAARLGVALVDRAAGAARRRALWVGLAGAVLLAAGLAARASRRSSPAA